MKITQEVRDFASKQNSSPDTFLEAAAARAIRPEPVEGLPFGKEGASTGSARTETEAEAEKPVPSDVEAGMAEMSERFREKGGEIYLPAAE
jgi:phosphomethylpyrimidine synthase